jgi:2-methylisocitrate lyase-like PEP mutase family enzyme
MKEQIKHSHLFRNLHVKGDPLILFNIWDVASAKSVADAGAKVIATSSWSVAAAHGYVDGENLPLELAIANIKRIVDAVEVPVSIDFEGGYANSLPELEKNISLLIDTGIVGINFEDQILGKNSLYSIEEQCARIAAIRKAATEKSMPLFINARTDIFLKADPSNHTKIHLKEALARTRAYANAGADGFFVPGLSNIDYIAKLCALAPIPINILMNSEDLSIKRLKEAGVARISYGESPFVQVMKTLKENTFSALQKDLFYRTAH